MLLETGASCHFLAECTASKIPKACLDSDQNFAYAFCSTGQVTDDETRPHLICSFGHLLCCLSQLERFTKHATKHRAPDAANLIHTTPVYGLQIDIDSCISHSSCCSNGLSIVSMCPGVYQADYEEEEYRLAIAARWQAAGHSILSSVRMVRNAEVMGDKFASGADR